MKARSDGGRPAKRQLESLRDIICVHMVQHAKPEIRQWKHFTRGQPPPDVEV